jgi:adenine-specific DNA-methyltransferase
METGFALRDRRLDGHKFRRQSTIGPYVVDFLCIEASLVVELDGGQHSTELDRARTACLEIKGYSVLRFWNNEVNDSFEGVLSMISRTEANRVEKKTLTQPLPQAGEGLVPPNLYR